jgi:hypothetical protein
VDLPDQQRGHESPGEATQATNHHDDEGVDEDVAPHGRRQRQQRSGDDARQACERGAEPDDDQAQAVYVNALNGGDARIGARRAHVKADAGEAQPGGQRNRHRNADRDDK